jgi:hypothetical protein
MADVSASFGQRSDCFDPTEMVIVAGRICIARGPISTNINEVKSHVGAAITVAGCVMTATQ